MRFRKDEFGRHITRRDFVNGMAAGAGAALTLGTIPAHGQALPDPLNLSLGEDWYGYGGANGSAPRDTLRKNYGRIAFAHSELDGLQHYGPAANEGRRAYRQLANAL